MQTSLTHRVLAPSLRRRAFATAALLLCGAGTTGMAWAQSSPAAYPTKPVTLITAFAVGSGPDSVLRLVAQKLSLNWKQGVTVDNRPGGGGFIAIEAARRAAPDGHTLLQLDSEHLSALPHLYKKRNFQTLQAFDPVAPLFRTPFLVAVPTQSPWKNVGDLIAAAKKGSVSYGSWGVGSPGHLGGEWLDLEAGTQMTHVPFREVSQLFTSVANGDPAWSLASIPSSQGIYKAGKIRYLAVAGPRRISQMPDVPTLAEAGGPAQVDVNSFVSLLAPKGVPAAVRAQIHADVLKVLQEPDVREKFHTFAFEPLSWSVEEIQRQAGVKSEQYKLLIQKSNISLD